MDRNEILSSKAKTTDAVNVDTPATTARSTHQKRILPERAPHIKQMVCACGQPQNTPHAFANDVLPPLADESRPAADEISELTRRLEDIRFAWTYHTEQALHHHDVASLLAMKEQGCVKRLHEARRAAGMSGCTHK